MACQPAPKPIPDATAVAADRRESIAWEAARAMLPRMPQEVDPFLGHGAYLRCSGSGGHRSGYAWERGVLIGTWSAEVRTPRVSDLPEGRDASAIPSRRRYLSRRARRLFARLCVVGLSNGDFEPAMCQLMGRRSHPEPTPDHPPRGRLGRGNARPFGRGLSTMPTGTSDATASTSTRSPGWSAPPCWWSSAPGRTGARCDRQAAQAPAARSVGAPARHLGLAHARRRRTTQDGGADGSLIGTFQVTDPQRTISPRPGRRLLTRRSTAHGC